MSEECQLCCEPSTDTVVCEFGHRICQACRGNTCPFCHPLDYIKLEEDTDAEAILPPIEPQRQRGRSVVVLTIVGNLVLGAASIKMLLSMVYPVDPVPQWAAWDDPRLELWLLEGFIGWLMLYGAIRFCCDVAFNPLELLLHVR